MNKILIILLLLLGSISNAQIEQLPKSRPNSIDGPTKVLVGLYVLDIVAIDNKEQSFTADVVIRLKWDDPRITNVKEPIPLNKIWNPNVQIYNLREVESRFPKIVTILNNNTVQYIQRYYAKLSNHLDFREFPFDEQVLQISLLAFGFTPDEVELEFEAAGRDKRFSISDWHIEPMGAKILEFKANLFEDEDHSEEIIRPKLDFEFKAYRYIQYYWWKVLAPLMVILFLSWAVFWIDPSQVGAQIGVSGTSILTLIAFLLRLENFLPPVSYLTRMDHFVFTSLILVFFAYVEALVSTTFALKGKKEFALKLDLIFRIAYPILFLIIIIVFWVN